jgi:hypothetical protein
MNISSLDDAFVCVSEWSGGLSLSLFLFSIVWHTHTQHPPPPPLSPLDLLHSKIPSLSSSHRHTFFPWKCFFFPRICWDFPCVKQKRKEERVFGGRIRRKSDWISLVDWSTYIYGTFSLRIRMLCRRWNRPNALFPHQSPYAVGDSQEQEKNRTKKTEKEKKKVKNQYDCLFVVHPVSNFQHLSNGLQVCVG